MRYTFHATDIVGYTYQADNHCPSCTEGFFQSDAPNDPTLTEESILDAAARVRGIDRGDEGSFDSGDFPKVIFANQVHDGCTTDNGYAPGQCADRCGTCGETLGGDCPNVAE